MQRLVASVWLCALVGCAQLYDAIDESKLCCHCHVEASRAWRRVRWNYPHVCLPRHFGTGFQAGYIDVCMGGDGCPPTLPPRKYRSYHYRNAEGRSKAIAWFNGFAEGAAAALCAGHGECDQIVTSLDVHGCRVPSGAEHHIDAGDLTPVPSKESAPEVTPVQPPGGFFVPDSPRVDAAYMDETPHFPPPDIEWPFETTEPQAQQHPRLMAPPPDPPTVRLLEPQTSTDRADMPVNIEFDHD